MRVAVDEPRREPAAPRIECRHAARRRAADRASRPTQAIRSPVIADRAIANRAVRIVARHRREMRAGDEEIERSVVTCRIAAPRSPRDSGAAPRPRADGGRRAPTHRPPTMTSRTGRRHGPKIAASSSASCGRPASAGSSPSSTTRSARMPTAIAPVVRAMARAPRRARSPVERLADGLAIAREHVARLPCQALRPFELAQLRERIDDGVRVAAHAERATRVEVGARGERAVAEIGFRRRRETDDRAARRERLRFPLPSCASRERRTSARRRRRGRAAIRPVAAPLQPTQSATSRVLLRGVDVDRRVRAARATIAASSSGVTARRLCGATPSTTSVLRRGVAQARRSAVRERRTSCGRTGAARRWRGVPPKPACA